VTGGRLRTLEGQELMNPALRVVAGAASTVMKATGTALTQTHLWHEVRQVLLKRVREQLGDNAVYHGHTLCKLEEGGDNDTVSLCFTTSNENQEEQLEVKVVLACDGTRSTVRSLASEPEDVLLDEGLSVWRGLAASVQSQGTTTWYRGASGQSGLIFPAGKDCGSSWTVIAPVVSGRSTTKEEAISRLKAALPSDTDPLLLDTINKSETIIENKLVTRDFTKPWASSIPRVAYLGDAMHPLRPTGEGTALALEDAWVIADMAASTDTAEEFLRPEMLRAFEEKRLKRVRAVSDAVKRQAEKFYKSPSIGGQTSLKGPEDGLTVAEAMRKYPIQYTEL